VRTETVWGVAGGVLAGYLGWLAAVSVGGAITTVSRWGPIVLIAAVLLAIWGALWGRRLRRRQRYPLAAFAFAVPVLPVLLTLGVLADTYL
jgi:hypothetical protein